MKFVSVTGLLKATATRQVNYTSVGPYLEPTIYTLRTQPEQLLLQGEWDIF